MLMAKKKDKGSKKDKASKKKKKKEKKEGLPTAQPPTAASS
jgi:hypothetical protein